MSGHDIVVIGASAGGIEALRTIFRSLPAELPAAIFVVLHLSPDSPSLLVDILARDARLPVRVAKDGEAITRGCAFVAPPDHHLLVEPGRMRLLRGPHENWSRPAVDPLFRSAAFSFGGRVVGVVLSGALDDGSAGLAVIKQRGGLAIVQDPTDCVNPGMPSSAIEHVDVDRIASAQEIATLLIEETSGPAVEASPATSELAAELARVSGAHRDPESLGTPSTFTCPKCHGTLWEDSAGKVLRYRCHVGHAFSSDHLESAQTRYQERALWTALRALEEQAAFFRRLSRRYAEAGNPLLADRYQQRNEDREHDAAIVRSLLTREPGLQEGA